MTPASNMRKVKGLMDNISLPTLGFYTFAAFMIVYGVHAAQGNPHVGRNAVEAMVCVHVGVSGYMCARTWESACVSAFRNQGGGINCWESCLALCLCLLSAVMMVPDMLADCSG